MASSKHHIPGSSATRVACAVAALVTLGLGLGLQLFSRTPLIDLAGGVLYTLLIGMLLCVLAPAQPALLAAFMAFAVSSAVELLQLTSLPASLVETVPILRLVLGRSFDARDFIAYLIGALAVWLIRSAIGAWSSGNQAETRL